MVQDISRERRPGKKRGSDVWFGQTRSWRSSIFWSDRLLLSDLVQLSELLQRRPLRLLVAGAQRFSRKACRQTGSSSQNPSLALLSPSKNDVSRIRVSPCNNFRCFSLVCQVVFPRLVARMFRTKTINCLPRAPTLGAASPGAASGCPPRVRQGGGGGWGGDQLA